MLKLAKDFYITKIDRDSGYGNSSLEKEQLYTFVYKKYRVELHMEFKIIGYTKENNIAIINFGYTVDIDRWSNKDQRYCFINDLDEADGKSTKKYFDSKDAREILLRFVERFIQSYLDKVSPSIIVRGALSEIKLNLPRYKRFDKLFCKHYTKKEFDIDKYDSLYKICGNYKEEKNKTIWVYGKKESHLVQLEEVVK